MDSNVSKNTFLNEFLNLQFTNFNYSIKNLLKQNLLPAIDLYGQNKNVCIDMALFSDEIGNKIILLENKHLASRSHKFFLPLQSKVITYRCAMAFYLTKYVKSSPKNIGQELLKYLSLSTHKSQKKFSMGFDICVTDSGWIDFSLSLDAVSLWLEKVASFNEKNSPEIARLQSLTTAENIRFAHNLFALQYIHSRCCSWLRLGEREKLIILGDRNFQTPNWSIAQPPEIIWRDEAENFYLSHPAEYAVLRQIFKIVDCWVENSGNWEKLAFNLGEAMLDFEAKCLIFGEVGQHNPQQAIARLGLMALIQLWLKKLLEEKLNISALVEV